MIDDPGSVTRTLVPPGMSFSGVDDAVVEALNYPAVLPGRQRRQMRKVDLGDLHSRVNGAAMGFAVCLVDHRGRISSRQLFRSLNWLPNTRLASSVGHNYVVLKAVPDGRLTIDGQLRLRLPASLLHYCDLAHGAPALIAGVPEHNMLIIHPPANVEEMIRGFHAEQFRRTMSGRAGEVGRE